MTGREFFGDRHQQKREQQTANQNMRMLWRWLLLAQLVHMSWAWQPFSIRSQPKSPLKSLPRPSLKILKKVSLSILTSIVISSSSAVFADESIIENFESAAVVRPIGVKMVTVTTSTKSASDSINKKDDSNDQTYSSSLKKEKVKQDAMKKTKQQRAQDLCERLGRGC